MAEASFETENETSRRLLRSHLRARGQRVAALSLGVVGVSGFGSALCAELATRHSPLSSRTALIDSGIPTGQRPSALVTASEIEYMMAEGNELDVLKSSRTNYSVLINDVLQLRSEPEIENGERLRPTDVAIAAAVSALFSAYQHWTAFPHSVSSVRVFPRGDSIPFDDGGLRIEWRTAPRYYVRLLVGRDGFRSSRVYYEFGDKYDIDRNVDSLGKWLQQL